MMKVEMSQEEFKNRLLEEARKKHEKQKESELIGDDDIFNLNGKEKTFFHLFFFHIFVII